MKSLIAIAAYDDRQPADLCVESLRRSGYKGEVVVLRERKDGMTPLSATAKAITALPQVPEFSKAKPDADVVLVVDPLTIFQSDPSEMLDKVGGAQRVHALAGWSRMINIADRLGLSVADRERVGTRRELKVRAVAFSTETGGASALRYLAELLEKHPTENPDVLLCQAAAAYGEHFDTLPAEQFDGFRAYNGPFVCFGRAEDAKAWLDGLPAPVSQASAPAKASKVDKVPAKAEAKA